MDEASELFVLYKQYSNNGKIWLMLGLDRDCRLMFSI